MRTARRALSPILSATMLTIGAGLSVSAVAQSTSDPSATGQSAPAPTENVAPSPPQGSTAPAETGSLDAAQPNPPPAATDTAPPASPAPAPAANETPPAEAPAAGEAQAPEAPAETQQASPETPDAPAAPAAPTQAQAPPPPPADPVVAALREKITTPNFGGSASEAERQAVAAFYQARAEGPLWVKSGGFTRAGDAIIAEVRKADEWGLSAAAFSLPAAPAGDTQAMAEAEAAMAFTVLQYARHARGGRIDPLALSPAFDRKPPAKDPNKVLQEISTASSADGYLRDLHPKHEQFVRLKEALAKLRGPVAPVEPEPVDEALTIKLPPGKTLRPGQDSPDVSLLRRRLKVTAEAGNENKYDLPLQEAVIAFQRANGIKANGQVGKQTRAALNGEHAPQAKRDPDRDMQRIVNNMERWRWMPQNLGAFYVLNNVPEFKSRAFKDGKQIYDERIVVGLPQWVTPNFSARMRTIVFHPEWGVPDGIKTKELQPQLRRSSGGNNFFEDLFGGGSSGSSSSAVLRRHDLRVSYNGQPVNPDTVNWNSVDIRRFQFTQPSGPKNVLGIVKFLFPNKHDVYMHDTTAKALFSQNMRAYSHGCIRVNNPVRFAELLLAEDKGWSAEEVGRRFGGGLNEVKIDKEVWVHNVYMTTYVDDAGKLHVFNDVYGFEPRITAALTGKNMQFEAVPQIAEVEPGEDGVTPAPQQRRKKQRVTQSDPLTEAIQGLFAN